MLKPLLQIHASLKRMALLTLMLSGIFAGNEVNAQTLPYIFNFTEDPFTNGWSQESVIGDQVWTYNAAFNNASFSAFSGGCQPNEDWLISPAFDLTASTDEELTVAIQKGFNGDNGLEVLYSSDYSGAGDPNLATWTLLTEATIQFFLDEGVGNNTSINFGPFTELQSVNEENVYVAFKFDFESGNCSTWRVAGLSLISAASPMLNSSEASIGGLTYVEGEGPSASASYEVTGTNLEGTGNILVTAPAGFEVSADDVDFSETLEVAFDAGEITGQPAIVYVRLAADQMAGPYSGAITHVGGGATADVAVSGVVSTPPPTDAYFIDFEGVDEVKTGYGTGNVVLSGLEWTLTQALIGDLAADFKNGTRSARLRGYGDTEMFMLQDKEGGIGTISFPYRRYGSDTQVAYKVEYSMDGGATWTQAGDEFTGTETVQTFTAEVNEAGPGRIKISTVATTGTDNRRLNIDDIAITDFAGEPMPTISASEGNITNLDYTVNEGPSMAVGYDISASLLDPETGTITVTAPENFEISVDLIDWTSSAVVDYSDFGGVLDVEAVFVRLAAGLPVGMYSGAIIHEGGTASAEVNVSGEVMSAISFLPEIFDLSTGDFEFTSWDASAAAGTYPESMRFYYSNDPTAEFANPNNDGTRLYDCGYDLTSRPRFNGLGEDGFSIIATGSPQRNNCMDGDADEDRYTGSAVIGVNPTGLDHVAIKWTARLVTEGVRTFGVRLQFRFGPNGGYNDFPGETTFSSEDLQVGDEQEFTSILPGIFLGQAELYLRFVYFQIEGEAGSRPEIGIDDISVYQFDPLSANDLDAKVGLNIYPNPASDVVNVDLSNFGEGMVNISLFDITGKLLEQSRVAVSANMIHQVNMSALKSGLYLMNVSGENESSSVRVIKQ